LPCKSGKNFLQRWMKVHCYNSSLNCEHTSKAKVLLDWWLFPFRDFSGWKAKAIVMVGVAKH